METNSKVFSPDLIQPGSLVIVIDDDKDHPIRFGLVARKTVSGLFDVKFGPCQRPEQAFALPEKVFLLTQTDGKFKDPKAAFEHYRDDIIVDLVVAIGMTREYQAVKLIQLKEKKLERKLRNRIGRGFLGLLSHIHAIGGKTKPPAQ